MKTLRTNKNLKLIIACIFTLNCLFPAQVVLALKDCGEHEVVSCEEHDDQHFVATHVGESSVTLDAPTHDFAVNSVEKGHDSAHQIENTKSDFATIPEISNDTEQAFLANYLVLNNSFGSNFEKIAVWPNAPPTSKNSFLSFLPSVRLQV